MKFALVMFLGVVSAIRVRQEPAAKGDKGPSIAEIFAHCDADNSKTLSLQEATKCAIAYVTKDIAGQIRHEWPMGADGKPAELNLEQAQAYAASKGM